MKLIIATLQLALLVSCSSTPHTNTTVPKLDSAQAKSAKLITDIDAQKVRAKKIRTVSERIDYKASLIH